MFPLEIALWSSQATGSFGKPMLKRVSLFDALRDISIPLDIKEWSEGKILRNIALTTI